MQADAFHLYLSDPFWGHKKQEAQARSDRTSLNTIQWFPLTSSEPLSTKEFTPWQVSQGLPSTKGLKHLKQVQAGSSWSLFMICQLHVNVNCRNNWMESSGCPTLQLWKWKGLDMRYAFSRVAISCSSFQPWTFMKNYSIQHCRHNPSALSSCKSFSPKIEHLSPNWHWT